VHELFIIAGPTASGKTAAAVALAQKIGGEVVSADSMQVYRGMDIGTAKPTLNEREGVAHHMIDVVNPDEAFSAALYQRMAAEAIADIRARGKVPILAGGTGFYINAVLYGNDFGEAAPRQGTQHASKNAMDEEPSGVSKRLPGAESGETIGGASVFTNPEDEIRKELTAEAALKGNAYLHEKLKQADPDYAAQVHPNNVRRVIRALAFFYSTGKKLSEHNSEQHKLQPLYDARFIVLNIERDELYRRIDRRVLLMFEQGLENEVQGLLKAGYHTGLVSMQGIGYKETAAFLQGQLTRGEAIELIKRNSRRYAKRQLTWFRHQAKGAEWIIR
jgi:tRNA dimethylallyltransferase